MTNQGVTPMSNGHMDDTDWSEFFPEESTTTISDTPKEERVPDEVELNSMILKKLPDPIWYRGDKGKCFIGEDLVIDFLIETGHGEYNGSEFIQRGKDKILRIVDKKVVSRFIHDYFMDLDEEAFEDENRYGVLKEERHMEDDDGNPLPPELVYFSQKEVRSAIIRYKWFSDKNVIYLSSFTDDDSILKQPKKRHLYTPIFTDTQDSVYTFFNNGIVKTTKDGSEMMKYEDVKDGFIWESRIIDKDITISKDEPKGDFVQLVTLAMSDGDKDSTSITDWKLDEKEFESFRTVYGYMLSNYCNNGETPCPVFVDRDSDGKHAEGGNGKSLIMGSLEHFKKLLPINGKNVGEKDKFLFSGVKLDTEFIFLDDVMDDFDFKTIYNYTTGDMEIERKFKNRIVIPKDNKPKIGVTTNYILPDTDYSTRRRQYIVEFGSFWHILSKKNGQYAVQNYFDGKRLFGQEWTDSDWNNFFNFGFKCIQEYLSKGVVQNQHSNYKRKQLVAQIEGVGINDGVCEWIVKYVNDNEQTLKVGMEYSKMYEDFSEYFEEEIIEKWDSTRFKKALWKICKEKKWDYNPHKAGMTQSSKRWLSGPKGNQTEHIRINIPIQTKM